MKQRGETAREKSRRDLILSTKTKTSKRNY